MWFYFTSGCIGVDMAEILGDTWRAPTDSGRCRVGWVWGGVSLPEPTRGSGERHELSSGVRDRAPAENGFWRILKVTERSFVYRYDKIWGGQFAIASPYSKFWMRLSPRPPWSTPMSGWHMHRNEPSAGCRLVPCVCRPQTITVNGNSFLEWKCFICPIGILMITLVGLQKKSTLYLTCLIYPYNTQCTFKFINGFVWNTESSPGQLGVSFPLCTLTGGH